MADRYGVSRDGKVIAVYGTELEATTAAPGYGVDPKVKGAIVPLTTEEAEKADGIATAG